MQILCFDFINQQFCPFQVLSDCTLANPADFSCYDEYGDPLIVSSIPAWGVCEKKTCPVNTYPEPTDVYCDGDINDWNIDPGAIHCKGNAEAVR
jgi:hypothetical protein